MHDGLHSSVISSSAWEKVPACFRAVWMPLSVCHLVIVHGVSDVLYHP